MKYVLAAAGAVFGILALLYIGGAAIMDVTVEGESIDRIANLHLMHNQEIGFLLGVGCAVISAILFSAAAIVAAIQPNALVLRNRS